MPSSGEEPARTPAPDHEPTPPTPPPLPPEATSEEGQAPTPPPDPPGAAEPPAPDSNKQDAAQQARMNICMVLTLTLMSTVLLAIVLLGLFLFTLVRPQEPDLAVTPQRATASPRSSEGANPITPNQIQDLAEVQRIVEGDIGTTAYAPEGDLLAIGMGHDILLYDPRNMAMVEKLTGHSHTINALAFSPTVPGRTTLLASCAVDESGIRLWDVDTARQLLLFEGYTGWIRNLTFSPDGMLLASAGTDQTVRLWDVQRGELALAMEGHTNMVSSVAFSPDGRLLASSSRDGTVRLWDVETGKPVSLNGTESEGEDSATEEVPGVLFQSPPNPATSQPLWTTGVAWHPEGGTLAVGTTDSLVRLISTSDGRELHTLEGHRGLIVIRGVAFSPDGATLATASIDGTIRLWESEDGTLRDTLDHEGAQIIGITWHPDGGVIASSSDESGTVYLWNTDDGSLEHTLPLAQGPIISLAYSPDGSILGTGGVNGTVRLHLLDDDEQVTLADGAQSFQSLAFLSDTDVAVATSSERGSAVLFNLTRTTQPERITDIQGAALSIAVNEPRTLLAIGTSDNEITLWDGLQHERIRTLKGPGGRIVRLGFQRSGKHLVASNMIGPDSPDRLPAIAIWDIQSGVLQHTLTAHADTITDIAVQPAGERLASTSRDGTLRLWDISSGTEQAMIAAEDAQGWFSRAAFSPDGSILVTGSPDGSLMFWNPQTARPLHTINVGRGILALAFRPDGAQLAVSLENHTLLLLEPVADSR